MNLSLQKLYKYLHHIIHTAVPELTTKISNLQQQSRIIHDGQSKIMGKEKGWTQTKYLEWIESLRRKNQGIEPLNNYNQLEQWQPVLFPLFERQNLYMSSSDGMCK